MDHDAVAFQEDVVVVAKRHVPFDGFIGGERVWMLEIFEIAPPAHLHGDW